MLLPEPLLAQPKRECFQKFMAILDVLHRSIVLRFFYLVLQTLGIKSVNIVINMCELFTPFVSCLHSKAHLTKHECWRMIKRGQDKKNKIFSVLLSKKLSVTLPEFVAVYFVKKYKKL
ncbi:hypothetical protein FOCC_FOCC016790 [Frankliniella occidentalis]|nr:hypothetical protein FOCC_FOCC016790 [Frankliniella occidentalis]